MEIKVYGTGWCGMTARTLRYLDSHGVKYEYIDIDKDESAAEWVRQHNDGKEKKPTIDVDGSILSEPSDAELGEALRGQPRS